MYTELEFVRGFRQTDCVENLDRLNYFLSASFIPFMLLSTPFLSFLLLTCPLFSLLLPSAYFILFILLSAPFLSFPSLSETGVQ